MIDYIIIGQGIAGTTLAFQLLKAGYSIKVIDQNPQHSSSKIASGLWNPVVLKRMKKVWQADAMLTELDSFYLELEQFLGTSIIDNVKIKRVLNNIEELNSWNELSETPALKNLLNPFIQPNTNPQLIAPFGLGEVKRSGRIIVADMLAAFREKLIELQCYEETDLDYSTIIPTKDHIDVNGIKARNIIFCEGYKARQNPWFKYLPFALTKGEVVKGSAAELSEKHPIHGGKFLLPLGKGFYKIGATYDWNNIDEETTEKGLEQLIKGWYKITTAKLTVTSHEAGIRPTVQDRRPLLGTHPQLKNFHIYNGLGSRGILMTPYLSKCMMHHLSGKSALHPEMSIERFNTLWSR